jgi:signal transduction histidine kinase
MLAMLEGRVFSGIMGQVVIFDNQIVMDPTFCGFLGLTHDPRSLTLEEFAGFLLNQDESIFHLEVENARKLGSMFSFELRIKTTDHQVRWLRFHGKTEKEALLCLVQDVTGYKIAENKTIDIISLVSHELRNPLSAAMLYASLLEEGDVAGPLNEKQLEFLSTIRELHSNLQTLIDDLMDQSRLERGALELECQATDVSQSIREGIRLIESAANQKHIQVEFPTEMPHHIAWSHHLRLVQVISNILGNAVKFTPNKGEVVLDVWTTEDFVVIGISDNGPGIPRSQQASIFKKYGQLGHNKAAGLGLGLYLSNEFVSRMGGSIEVMSKEGEGTSFIITLLRKPPPA